MKTKLKQILISFIVTTIFYFALSQTFITQLGLGSPQIGLLYVFGLLFGPFGALGASLSNVAIDVYHGYTFVQILPSAIISFGVSLLAYKLWYSGFKSDEYTKPRLDTIYHLCLFLASIIICGMIYAVGHGNLAYILISPEIEETIIIPSFLNFTNVAFIMGIVGIWLFKRTDLVETPKKSERHLNKNLYRLIFCLLIVMTIVSFILIIANSDNLTIITGLIIVLALMYAYLTKPFIHEIQEVNENSIIAKIVRNFIIITLILGFFGGLVSIASFDYVETSITLNIYLHLMPILVISDIIIILFFIPGIIILKYIGDNVVKPITSFSEIEGFIKEDEKIEAEGLIKVYSEYVNEQNEIGTLARSYTELINHNNNYIENIQKIEGEKERINAELDIATNIQAAALPTEAIKTDAFIVNGYSKPAKEVGGDFFDYYELDDGNLAIVIGDASGKGVPAALVAMITQVVIKQTLINNHDPSEVLFSLNNQLCVNNPESMFITLWLGIYNKTNKKLTFSNAGHNPPLIKENGKFKYLDIKSGIVLGIMEDFQYEDEEVIIEKELVTYTDGITDANNNYGEMYGEDRLLEFFNEFKSDKDPILPLLKDINDFTKDTEQFDDMTLLYLKVND